MSPLPCDHFQHIRTCARNWSGKWAFSSVTSPFGFVSPWSSSAWARCTIRSSMHAYNETVNACVGVHRKMMACTCTYVESVDVATCVCSCAQLVPSVADVLSYARAHASHEGATSLGCLNLGRRVAGAIGRKLKERQTGSIGSCPIDFQSLGSLTLPSSPCGRANGHHGPGRAICYNCNM